MNLRLLVASLVVAVIPTMAFGAELRVTSSIDEVMVHPNTARITRVAKASVPAGAVTIALEGLTPKLQDDSVRLQTRGGARARLLGFSVENQALTESSSEELRKAEAALRGLEESDRAYADAIAAAGKQREFLDSLRATYVSARSENLGARPANPKEWASMVDYVGREHLAISEEIRKIELQRRLLAPSVSAARAEVARLQSAGQRAAKRVVLELAVERGGGLDLELSYLVSGASWQPSWDARLDPDAGRLELELQARVEQYTGEDWEGVRLSVSTSRPGQQIHVPELEPLFLEQRVERKVMAERMSEGEVSRESIMKRAAPAAPPAAASAPAEIDLGLLSTTFTATARASVPSTGEPRKSSLGTFPQEVKLVRVAAPSEDERAFLVAEATNSTGVPILAGPVELFLGNSFVGRAQLDEVPVGDELKLGFGPDPRIKIVREVLDRSREDKGLFSKREKISYRTRTTLKSLYQAPVEVRIFERVPTSRDEDISVTDVVWSVKPDRPADPMKPGVESWLLNLAPGSDRALELRYSVSYPKGKSIRGLP